MQPYKRLALVKYDEYTGARSAYDSPKVIFDNRFVKVYWYNPNTVPTPPAAGKNSAESLKPKEEEQPFDKEEFERNAMAAQKKLEEKKVQMKEMERKRQALVKQKEELAQKQAEEKRKLIEKLAAKGVVSGDTTMTNSTTNGTNGADDSKASAHTKALREKVAELEAEAKSLGLDSALSDYTPRGRGRGRGRGSYRGWEGFAGRGGAFDAPRGRGGFRGRGGGKYNLDNRTKQVAVSSVDFDTSKDEALRSYLLVSSATISVLGGILIKMRPRASANTLPSNLILMARGRRSSHSKTVPRPRTSCTAPKRFRMSANPSSTGTMRRLQLRK